VHGVHAQWSTCQGTDPCYQHTSQFSIKHPVQILYILHLKVLASMAIRYGPNVQDLDPIRESANTLPPICDAVV
jgi:hypothetical protein